MKLVRVIALILLAAYLVGCRDAGSTASDTESIPVTSTASPTPDSSLFLTQYVFPTTIDPTKRYMFYLHSRIIEDQGIPAVSPEYGNYEYEAILEKLASHGFMVISEQRTKGTNSGKYAERVVGQVRKLLNAGVPAKNITIVGASKGASIAILVSYFSNNEDVNFVLLGSCHPDIVAEFKREGVSLSGNLLSIYDYADDEYSGSCEELYQFSEGKGLARHEEIVLHVGTGHGILYKPLDEWILPAVQWADQSTSTEIIDEEVATLNSLEQVDDHPLYTMHYFGTYTRRVRSYPFGASELSQQTVDSAQTSCLLSWGCSLFAALGDEDNRLLGRNFDWHFSPALLLFYDPSDRYASVSMVDIEYLGFGGDRSRNLTNLPLEGRRALLDAPSLPFDGMNEKGLSIGMAAVPAEDMPYDPQIKTLDELDVIREILDHAKTVDEAVDILGSYNIDMGSVPIHYLIASTAGDSALVEFYRGEMVVLRNEMPWQVATNLPLAATHEDGYGQCWRYDLIHRRLEGLEGRISPTDAFHLLEEASQDVTQWSITYDMTNGNLQVVMGRDYSNAVPFHLERSVQ